MSFEIKVPAMGESLSQATIGAILKAPGSTVRQDEEILELETDKLNQVLYAPQSGVLQLSVHTGDVVAIGQVIGHIEAGGALPPALPPVPPVAKEPPQRVLASEQPLAAPPKKQGRGETKKPLSSLRKAIGKRLVEVQQQTASLTTFNEVDMSEVLALREQYKELFMQKHGVKLGFMPFFIKAACSALQAFPMVNSYLDGESVVFREYIDISVAVATEKGLFVPVVRDADNLSFADIETRLEVLARRAKEGSITLDELKGGSFTITNGGIFGSMLSTPILNPPQCAILGMHAIKKRPVAIGDEVVVRPIMYLALTYDHRLLDGKEAASFLVHIKNCIEDPHRLELGI